MARKDLLEVVTSGWAEKAPPADKDDTRFHPYLLGNDPNMVMVPWFDHAPAMVIRVNWREFHVYNPNRPKEKHHVVAGSLQRAVNNLLELEV